jgi:hypothetical protein
MSSTAVVDQSKGLTEIAEQLRLLREKAERYKVDATDATTAALYTAVSRDLFDLNTKVRSYAGIIDPLPQLPFGLLRTKDLNQPDQAKLLAFLAEQVRVYLELQGGSFSSNWAVTALAQRLHTTQDEIWYGVTYGEHEGLFTSERGQLVLTPAQ